MKTPRILALIGLSSLSFATACGSDEKPFVPLDELCNVYAEELCEGREACCTSSDREVCESQVRATCQADTKLLTAEDGLDYDGRRADRLRKQLRDRVQACEPPLFVGRFFKGTRAVGAACERPGQCESLTCQAPASGSETVCLDAVDVQLCDPADTDPG